MKISLKPVIPVLFLILVNFSTIGAFIQIILGRSIGLESKPRILIFSPLPLVFDKKDFFTVTEVDFITNVRTHKKVNPELVATVGGPDSRKLHFARILMFINFYPEDFIMPVLEHMFCTESYFVPGYQVPRKVEIKTSYQNQTRNLELNCVI